MPKRDLNGVEANRGHAFALVTVLRKPQICFQSVNKLLFMESLCSLSFACSFAYVQFQDKESMKKALALNGTTIEGRPIVVDVAYSSVLSQTNCEPLVCVETIASAGTHRTDHLQPFSRVPPSSSAMCP
jgi:hypothetical protein